MRWTGVQHMSDEKYADYIAAVIKECPDAEAGEVAEAFKKYEEEFYIPPQDAMRSVVRRFQSGTSPGTSSNTNNRAAAPTKKVSALSELSGNDRDVEVEVKIITHNVRDQLIRGEERQIVFGMLEDDPWNEGTPGTRWDYKDWGPSPQLTAGSIVRLEGASVNEYNGKMSLNINQSTRVVVLKEGTGATVATNDPVDVADLPSDGYVCVVGRVLASRPDQIHRKDGSGSIDVVRGRIADATGTIGFLSWEPFDHEVGALIKIDGAQVRSFRDTPELNFGRTTRIEVFHDAQFADLDTLSEQTTQTIAQLRDGSRDVDAVVQILEWNKRSFTRDGVEKFLWSGQIADPSGRCRMSAWEELPISSADLPVTVRLKGVRVRAWQGIPDITVDTAAQVEVLAAPPWDEAVDLSNHAVEVPLSDVVAGPSRVGLKTEGMVVSVREDSGFIRRCTECRRVLRDGACYDHGANEGSEDVRLRLVLDAAGSSTAAVLVNKEASMAVLEMNEADMRTQVDELGEVGFVQAVRERLLGRNLSVNGRSIVDDQGAMILADGVTLVAGDAQLRATELRTLWGWS
jgi:ssDNA-binding replication factor A large subunit